MNLIIEPFNLTFCLFVGTVLVSVILFALFIRKKPLKTRRKIMFIFTSFFAVFLLFYKFSYRLDAQFIKDYSKYWGEYTVFNELPFNPCNLVILLYPFALKSKNSYLLSYCVFMGTIAAGITICIPMQGYAGYSIFSWHTFGFFLLHSISVAVSLVIIPLGLYVPEYIDALKSSAVLIAIWIFSILLSLMLRISGLSEYANYMFTMSTESNAFLEIFYNLIPVKGVYLLPLLLIYYPFCVFTVFISKTLKKKSNL